MTLVGSSFVVVVVVVVFFLVGFYVLSGFLFVGILHWLRGDAGDEFLLVSCSLVTWRLRCGH